MKKYVFVLSLMSIMLSGCGGGPSAEEILRKYETYSAAAPDLNKIGIYISSSDREAVQIRYSHVDLNLSEKNAELLANRFFVADAGNPTKIFPCEVSAYFKNAVRGDNGEIVQAQEHYTNIDMKKAKAKFIIVGFKGIDKSESEELETPPLFFIVSLGGISPESLLDDNSPERQLLNMKTLLTENLFEKENFADDFQTFTGSLRINDKAYSIRVEEINRFADGFVGVLFTSKDIGTTEINFWKETGIAPFKSEIIVNNTTHVSHKLNMDSGILLNAYDTKEMPDTIILRVNDGFMDKQIVFDGKTKAVIE